MKIMDNKFVQVTLCLIASVHITHDICTYMYVEMKKNDLRKHKIIASHKLEFRERPSSGFQFGVISV